MFVSSCLTISRSYTRVLNVFQTNFLRYSKSHKFVLFSTFSTESTPKSDSIWLQSSPDILRKIENGEISKPTRNLRQHVNPLSIIYKKTINIEDQHIMTHLTEPKENPLYLDIGCAKGNWVNDMAHSQPHINFLGLEIRTECVIIALQRRQRMNNKNSYFINTNANVDLPKLLSYLTTQGVFISTVSIQFPDPHFKTKHKKRRVVNEDVVNTLSQYLPANSRIFLQSDVLEMQTYMVTQFSGNRYFLPAEGYDTRFLNSNKSPVSVKTEREIAVEARGLPVYRMMFVRNSVLFEQQQQPAVKVDDVVC